MRSIAQNIEYIGLVASINGLEIDEGAKKIYMYSLCAFMENIATIKSARFTSAIGLLSIA